RRDADDDRRRQAVPRRPVADVGDRADRVVHRGRRPDAADGFLRPAAAQTGRRTRTGAVTMKSFAWRSRAPFALAVLAALACAARAEAPVEFAPTIPLVVQGGEALQRVELP